MPELRKFKEAVEAYLAQRDGEEGQAGVTRIASLGSSSGTTIGPFEGDTRR